MTTYTTSTGNTISINLDSTTQSISLARTGGQGTKGDSVTNVSINEDSELILEISNAAGVVVETINAGALFSQLNVSEIADITLTNIQDADYLAYNSSTQEFENHQLTTTKMTDIDNSGKTDGAILVYNGTQYAATSNLDNENTAIIGGTF